MGRFYCVRVVLARRARKPPLMWISAGISRPSRSSNAVSVFSIVVVTSRGETPRRQVTWIFSTGVLRTRYVDTSGVMNSGRFSRASRSTCSAARDSMMVVPFGVGFSRTSSGSLP